jgi:methylated-DNA-[protein]-cysteine S-methyltransferase
MNYFFHETPIGEIAICARGDAIIGLCFGRRIFPEAKNTESLATRTAFTQLAEYLDGTRKKFDLELIYGGSKFQTSVWNQLMQIPYGETKSYKEIACFVNNPKSCLAVGKACGKNPIPIFVPCQRVIGSNGDLTGYGGGIDLKKKLLDMEKKSEGT